MPFQFMTSVVNITTLLWLCSVDFGKEDLSVFSRGFN